MRLKDKVVAVTASTRGIGLAAARACAQEGAVVFFAARSPEQAEIEAEKLRQEGCRAFCVYNDASKPETYGQMVEQIVEKTTRSSAGSTVFTLKKGAKLVSAIVYDPMELPLDKPSRYRKSNLPATGVNCTLPEKNQN